MHLKFANRNPALHETLGSVAQPFTLPAAQLTGSSPVRTIQNSRFVLLGKQISALKTRVRARANLAKIPLAEGLSLGHMPRVSLPWQACPERTKSGHEIAVPVPLTAFSCLSRVNACVSAKKPQGLLPCCRNQESGSLRIMK